MTLYPVEWWQAHAEFMVTRPRESVLMQRQMVYELEQFQMAVYAKLRPAVESMMVSMQEFATGLQAALR